ncbi:MAG: hypothetical protein IRY92_05370 [Dactylosporangium sp.]|nr:hypothetical protein [Dactylosporangium sp.]
MGIERRLAAVRDVTAELGKAMVRQIFDQLTDDELLRLLLPGWEGRDDDLRLDEQAALAKFNALGIEEALHLAIQPSGDPAETQRRLDALFDEFRPYFEVRVQRAVREARLRGEVIQKRRAA